MGKKRGIRYPSGVAEKFGRFVDIKGIKENFWKALFRSKNKELPEGFIDLYSFFDLRNNDNPDS